MGKTPLRRGFRSDASSFCTPERGRACLFQSIFCDFTRTSASGEPAMSHKTGEAALFVLSGGNKNGGVDESTRRVAHRREERRLSFSKS